LSKAFLTPYGGVNRIGGNIFLIEDSNSKVFLDFGLDFEKYRLYFDYPINPPKTTSELVTTGILPKIFSHNGKQFFQYCELEKKGDKSGKEWDIIENPPDEDFSVIISHAHLDHIANSIFLPSSVPIWLSTFSKLSFLTRHLVKRASTLYEKLALSPKIKERGYSIEKLELDLLRNKYQIFRNNVPFKVQDILVEPYAVDHSIPGAFGFLLRTKDSTIAYTGDFRMHGVAEFFSRKFFEKLSKERVDYFICEGTNLGLNQVKDEKEVESSIELVLKKFFDHEGEHAIIVLSQTNVDRISKMYGIARKMGLNFYVSDEIFLLIYYILSGELKDRIISPMPAIVRNHALEEKAREHWPGSNEVKSYGVLLGGERKLKGLAEKLSLNTADENDFSKIPPKTMILLHNLPTMLHRKFSKKSLIIVSTTEHENEESLYDLERFINQAMLIGIPLLRAHSSGHASVIDLIEVIKTVNPRNLIPVHTQHQDFFKSYFEKLCDINVIIPNEGQPITL